jgi:hypothetical protein
MNKEMRCVYHIVEHYDYHDPIIKLNLRSATDYIDGETFVDTYNNPCKHIYTDSSLKTDYNIIMIMKDIHI